MKTAMHITLVGLCVLGFGLLMSFLGGVVREMEASRRRRSEGVPWILPIHRQPGEYWSDPNIPGPWGQRGG